VFRNNRIWSRKPALGVGFPWGHVIEIDWACYQVSR